VDNKKHADEDSAFLSLFKRKAMHDKQYLLSCINLERPGTTDSTWELIFFMDKKVQPTLRLICHYSVQKTADKTTSRKIEM